MTRRLPPVALGLALALAALPAFAYQPTDPDFDQQWGLRNTGQEVEYRRGTPGADVDAVRAWDLSRGAGVVIAVADTGVRHDDADLAATMWKSPGLTIDGKTCPEGTHGYDFYEGDCDPKGTHSHGSNVAMTAAGAGNNGVGGIGLAFDARVMALRVGTLPVFNATTKSSFAQAVRWAIEARRQDVNVRVLNISFGGDAYGGVLHAAIRDAGDAGILTVAGAGNDSDRNNDEQPFYPCAYDLPTLICVGGSDQDDNLLWSWGPTTVDLVAPAVNLGYGCGGGTSCSTPLVSAAAALVWSRQPGLTPEQVKAKILHNVDPLPDPDDRAKVLTGGRLNAYRALTGPIPDNPPSSTSTTAPSGGGGSTPTTAPGSPPPGTGPGGGSGGSGSEGSGGGGGSDPGAGGPSDGSGPSGSTGSGDSATGASATGADGRTRGDGPSGTGTADDDDSSTDSDSDADAPGATPPGGRGDAVARYADDGGGRGGWWLVGGGTTALAGAALLTRRRWLPLLPFG